VTTWRVQARDMLSDGFGVEDIAVRLSVPVEDVRLLVRALRASGMLADLLNLKRVGPGARTT
jgi:hypothetical protein